MASISSVHWSDGGVIDLEAVAAALKRQGAVFLIDATQSAGVLAMDVGRPDPDFVIFPTYKWLLGPYGRAFIYVVKRHQDGVPLEQTAFGRRNVHAENEIYLTDVRYVSDARRFDMGERDHFISMEMAAIGMEMMAQWGRPAIVERLAMLTARLAEGLRGFGVDIPDVRVAKDGETKLNVVELLVRASLVKSKGEARRLVEQRGVKIDNAVAGLDTELAFTGTPVVQYGKRKYARITWA